jgi:hypothetical protein
MYIWQRQREAGEIGWKCRENAKITLTEYRNVAIMDVCAFWHRSIMIRRAVC